MRPKGCAVPEERVRERPRKRVTALECNRSVFPPAEVPMMVTRGVPLGYRNREEVARAVMTGSLQVF